MKYNIVRFENGRWGISRIITPNVPDFLSSTGSNHWHFTEPEIIDFCQVDWEWQARRMLKRWLIHQKNFNTEHTVKESIDA